MSKSIPTHIPPAALPQPEQPSQAPTPKRQLPQWIVDLLKPFPALIAALVVLSVVVPKVIEMAHSSAAQAVGAAKAAQITADSALARIKTLETELDKSNKDYEALAQRLQTLKDKFSPFEGDIMALLTDQGKKEQVLGVVQELSRLLATHDPGASILASLEDLPRKFYSKAEHPALAYFKVLDVNVIQMIELTSDKDVKGLYTWDVKVAGDVYRVGRDGNGVFTQAPYRRAGQ